MHAYAAADCDLYQFTRRVFSCFASHHHARLGRLWRRAKWVGALRRDMPNRRSKILLIEDDREAAAVIAEELTQRGFALEVANGGGEGLFLVMRTAPDLILCDLSMPSMSGFEVLQKLNEIAPRSGKIPFLFLTGMSDRDNELKARRLGADDYITKPIDFDRLVLIINARLNATVASRGDAKVSLSDRQIEVLSLVASGLTSAEIADELRLSRRTIDFHIDCARSKLNATTRSEAVIKAAASGLIKPVRKN
jgi:DNA-binding NarL/FixJ family response regulator